MTGALRVGIVGAGFMGGTHLGALVADGVPVTVFDPSHEKAAAMAASRGASLAASLDELIGGVDVVDVCAPTHHHATIAIAAARAGRHVICEKPLARTEAQAEAMLDACTASGVRLFPAHVVRYFPEYEMAQQIVANGEVGDPAVLRLKRASFRPRHGPGHWFFDHAKSGGLIVDLMVHDFDFARWVAGQVISVHCRSVGAARPDLGVDHAFAIVTHSSGAISHITGSWAYGGGVFRTALEIAGSEGLLEFDSEARQPMTWYLHGASSEEGRAVGLAGSPVAVDPYRVELRDFLRAIGDGGPTRVEARDGIEALRIALAAEESAQTGRAIRLAGAAAA
jgi:myo-inositol 2-dehydrogenase / D-chiro-inositol 1-dehydrogenase